jgi:putative endonuclease
LSTNYLPHLGRLSLTGHRGVVTRTSDAVGAYGERVAARLLTEAGMRVVDRNWRCASGELDIVAVHGDQVIFCEVKTRRGERFGAPSESVGAAKVRRLRALASIWLAGHPDVRGRVRFDVVSVWPQESGPAVVEHVRGAF